MIVVADSSPLIALSRVGRIRLLKEMFGRLVVPEAVWQELTAGDTNRVGVSELLQSDWIERRTVSDRGLVNLLRRDLGAGEAEAIVLAREIDADVLLIDERLGRSAAESLGITITGLVGILIEAKQRQLLTDPIGLANDLRDRAGFWISDSLMNLILQG
jgi:predicted nucleic acid-binding protein